MGEGLPPFGNLKYNKYKKIFNQYYVLNKSHIFVFCIYQPAVLFLVGIRDDNSVSITKEGGCQAGSCSSNVSKGNFSLAALSSINVLVLLV